MGLSVLYSKNATSTYSGTSKVYLEKYKSMNLSKTKRRELTRCGWGS